MPIAQILYCSFDSSRKLLLRLRITLFYLLIILVSEGRFNDECERVEITQAAA